jgi:hypothetical protein
MCVSWTDRQLPRALEKERVLTLRHPCLGRQEYWTLASTQPSDAWSLNINARHLNPSSRTVDLWASLSNPSHQMQIIKDT